jgi:transcriptional regulator with XRE-family HTH domain
MPLSTGSRTALRLMGWPEPGSEDVNSRITFGAELRYAMHVRGLSLTEVARHSGVAIATASSAAMGRPVNVTTALRVARAVADRPIIPELLEWVQRPDPFNVGLKGGHRATPPSPPPATLATSPLAKDRVGSRRPRHPSASPSGQLRIAVD